jgi:hypothetical protein
LCGGATVVLAWIGSAGRGELRSRTRPPRGSPTACQDAVRQAQGGWTRIRRLLGAALTVPVLIGAVLLVSARPAVACTCAIRTEAQVMADAGAVLSGGWSARELTPRAWPLSSATGSEKSAAIG